jgi:hypothetical protein
MLTENGGSFLTPIFLVCSARRIYLEVKVLYPAKAGVTGTVISRQ